jgi:aminoglycoside 6'-N-acetyltransferase I
VRDFARTNRAGSARGEGIRLAEAGDCEALARLRARLWPASSAEEHARELETILVGMAGKTAMIIFVWVTREGSLAGFLETRLRSHADECDESQPVGYVEGWYVDKEYRRQGIGSKLLRAAEEWARRQGCKEMASDAEIDNELSQRAHKALGFEAVSRTVNYRKAL